ncbi:MAG: EamA family transporter RarD [Microbacteriaceae bacterium]
MNTSAPRASGIWYAIGAYVLWGLLPLYFLSLAPVGAWELVAMRILFSVAFCALLILLAKNWRQFWSLATQPRVLLLFGLAGALIWVNWTVYVVAVLSDHVVEASLGYFINPLVTIFLGVFLLRERLRPLQWTAVAISFVAVVALSVAYGQIPYLALTLAVTFGLYGFVKKKAGPSVDALSGLTLETVWLVPIAIVQLVLVAQSTGIVFGNAGVPNAVLLSLAGIVTATPLLMFAAAARRVPLVYLGLFQFAAPVMQFIVAVAILHEAMTTERWVGFIIIWVACAVLIVDALRSARAHRADIDPQLPVDETDPLASIDDVLRNPSSRD